MTALLSNNRVWLCPCNSVRKCLPSGVHLSSKKNPVNGPQQACCVVTSMGERRRLFLASSKTINIWKALYPMKLEPDDHLLYLLYSTVNMGQIKNIPCLQLKSTRLCLLDSASYVENGISILVIRKLFLYVHTYKNVHVFVCTYNSVPLATGLIKDIRFLRMELQVIVNCPTWDWELISSARIFSSALNYWTISLTSILMFLRSLGKREWSQRWIFHISFKMIFYANSFLL